MYSYEKSAYLIFKCVISYSINKQYKIANINRRYLSWQIMPKTNIGNEGRVELHEKLSLTGAEISIDQLPAGASVPFVHSHKNNEEIYGILSGKGKAVIDNETIELTAGDWLRISPAAKRQFFASQESDITYVCIQVKENSLGGFTADDAVLH